MTPYCTLHLPERLREVMEPDGSEVLSERTGGSSMTWEVLPGHKEKVPYDDSGSVLNRDPGGYKIISYFGF